MSEVWLARHGETTWNVAGRYQGRLESPLSPLGVRQAAALAQYFGDRAVHEAPVPQRIVSSPLRRCYDTAAATAARLALPVETDERLIEIGHGTWEGRYRDELARNDPDRYRAWREAPESVRFDGGESLADVLARWQSFAAALAAANVATLVVTHDAVIRCALVDAAALGLGAFWDVAVENAAFARFAARGERLALIDACVTQHLDGLRAATERQAL